MATGADLSASTHGIGTPAFLPLARRAGFGILKRSLIDMGGEVGGLGCVIASLGEVRGPVLGRVTEC